MAALFKKHSDGCWDKLALPEETPFVRKTWQVLPFVDGGRRAYALMTNPGSGGRVNGRFLLPLEILSHRDEILLGGERLVFSAISSPETREFQLRVGDRRPRCAVCRCDIEDGQLCVECPGCGRLFHELEEKHCFTFQERCRFCDHPTALTGDQAWHPELEEESVYD